MEIKLEKKQSMALGLERHYSGEFTLDVTADDPIDVLVLSEAQYKILKEKSELDLDNSVEYHSGVKRLSKETIVLSEIKFVVLGNSSDKDINVIVDIKEKNYYDSRGTTGVSGIGTSAF